MSISHENKLNNNNLRANRKDSSNGIRKLVPCWIECIEERGDLRTM